jgi:nitrate reductase molybdenum cofactor assembly chaperone NarJ/NarW
MTQHEKKAATENGVMIPDRPPMLDALAALLEYPGEDSLRRAQEARDRLCVEDTPAAALVDAFLDRVGGLGVEELQELFVRAFDINPVCCLEVGWHIHGDNYDRGDFLVRMRQRMRELGVEESDELPDHLRHVLAVIARLPVADAAELIGRYALPALEKMLEGFRGKDCPYEHVLRAVQRVLTAERAAA